MTNQEIFQIAMQQSAIDSSCQPEDFQAKENRLVISGTHPKARRYLQLPFSCDLTSYGSNIVASVSEPLRESVWEYIQTYETAHCFETPNLHVLDNKLNAFGLGICFMAEYWLLDMPTFVPLDCAYETRLLSAPDFAGYYLPEWSNALCEARKQLDCLAIGAFDQGKLIGLAGASADCDAMWQIGIDVLPDYRQRGIASALTSQLAAEILKRGIVPFYCCAWSNIKSARNAFKSGFKPAWVQVTAKSLAYIADMNQNK